MNGFQIDAVHNALEEKDAEIRQLKIESNENLTKLLAQIVAMRTQIDAMRAEIERSQAALEAAHIYIAAIGGRALENKP